MVGEAELFSQLFAPRECGEGGVDVLSTEQSERNQWE
jgi:hypothetical protein